MSGVSAVTAYCLWSRSQSTSNSATSSSQSKDINSEMLIVGMSHRASDEELAVAFSHGMHFFLPKPIEIELMMALLNVRKNCRSLHQAIDYISSMSWAPEGKDSHPRRDENKTDSGCSSVEADCTSDNLCAKNVISCEHSGLIGIKLFRRMSATQNEP